MIYLEHLQTALSTEKIKTDVQTLDDSSYFCFKFIVQKTIFTPIQGFNQQPKHFSMSPVMLKYLAKSVLLKWAARCSYQLNNYSRNFFSYPRAPLAHHTAVPDHLSAGTWRISQQANLTAEVLPV